MIAASRRLIESFYEAWKQPWLPPQWRLFGFSILGGLLLTPLVYLLPLLGYDWHRLFYLGFLDQYPPWMIPIFSPFRLVDWRWSLAIANSISLVGLAALTAVQAPRIRWDGLFAAALVLLTPPLWYMLWDGQIDGLITVAILLLPWSVPIALFRPQTMAWVLVSRRTNTLVMLGWLALSLVIWPGWLTVALINARGSVTHPTAIGWLTLGWPILFVGLGMWLAAFRQGDYWRLLAAGLIASPYVQPYHMVLLLPALGRVSGYKRLVLFGLAWLVGLVPALLGFSRYLALLFPIAVWWFLRPATPTIPTAIPAPAVK